MTTACVHLPRLVLIHAPQLDLSIVGARYDERKIWMKAGPVYATIVALKDVLYNAIRLAEQVRCIWILQMVIQTSGSGSDVFLAETWKNQQLVSNVKRL